MIGMNLFKTRISDTLLYHNTGISSLISILEEGTLRKSENSGNSVSFSRNFFFSHREDTLFKISFYKDKLVSKYKIVPFSLNNGLYGKRSIYGDESEERVYSDINNVLRYIEGITITKENLKVLDKYLRQQLYIRKFGQWEDSIAHKVSVLGSLFKKNDLSLDSEFEDVIRFCNQFDTFPLDKIDTNSVEYLLCDYIESGNHKEYVVRSLLRIGPAQKNVIEDYCLKLNFSYDNIIKIVNCYSE